MGHHRGHALADGLLAGHPAPFELQRGSYAVTLAFLDIITSLVVGESLKSACRALPFTLPSLPSPLLFTTHLPAAPGAPQQYLSLLGWIHTHLLCAFGVLPLRAACIEKFAIGYQDHPAAVPGDAAPAPPCSKEEGPWTCARGWSPAWWWTARCRACCSAILVNGHGPHPPLAATKAAEAAGTTRLPHCLSLPRAQLEQLQAALELIDEVLSTTPAEQGS